MLTGAREVEVFEAARGRLEAIAYRLLGSASDAEDAVQDTFLRWQSADREYVETPEAWLTKVLTNLCLNRLTSARARRETYVGQWLPEPVFAGDRMLGPSDTVEQRESVSIAMLTLMERLSAKERVVYVLREAFGYSHAEIAEVLDVTESNCQQIYRRAKRHLAADRRRVEVDTAAARKIVEEFLAAALSGRTDALVRLLADDAISVGDGGGVLFSLPRPITGAVRVARFLRGLFKPSAAKWSLIGGKPELFSTIANGVPALALMVEGKLVGVVSLEVTADGIAAVHAQVNPAKLDRAAGQWGISERGEPLTVPW
ncbi:RNA polymerase sigma-70 factor [Amycolatopsis sp. CB00013]|uniref:RNA polymerase sigma-70 factor n=1 Tax=Amycolatopsis sp. CB00013 TaxID=1703945 RepID=UPI00093FFEBB|nr:RNA polymerase sigma-70 factor [Amycolatopsis sp. CB00013]OKJ92010.1 RNA polymerase subunit sigma-70 [Amycolatopsis sp. CB00013]